MLFMFISVLPDRCSYFGRPGEETGWEDPSWNHSHPGGESALGQERREAGCVYRPQRDHEVHQQRRSECQLMKHAQRVPSVHLSVVTWCFCVRSWCSPSLWFPPCVRPCVILWRRFVKRLPKPSSSSTPPSVTRPSTTSCLLCSSNWCCLLPTILAFTLRKLRKDRHLKKKWITPVSHRKHERSISSAYFFRRAC